MAEKPSKYDLNFTDDEFVALHAAASAEGVEINDFIVATLRKHAEILRRIEKEKSHGGTMEEEKVETMAG